MRVCHATLIPLDTTNRHWFLRPPLTAGYLTAYADAHRPERDEHDIVDTVELAALPVAEAIAERLLRTDPEIIALSTYVWNHAEVASVCSRIRALAPRVHIVLGGPEVAFTPARAFESFEADWDFVHIIVTFARLLGPKSTCRFGDSPLIALQILNSVCGIASTHAKSGSQ